MELLREHFYDVDLFAPMKRIHAEAALIPAAAIADDPTKTFMAISFAKYVLSESPDPIRVLFSDSVTD